ncbi:MAG: transposase [Leptotrichiaceae bacterium]|nr:transposase [Leptotrichiaceae bacterium]
MKNAKDILKHLGRYLVRSSIAEYRITDIIDDKITFFFNDLANDKKKSYITLPNEKFIP